MSVFNARIVHNSSCCISPRISNQSSTNDNTQRLATTEITEQHGSITLFHFQNDQMWPVNMTGKTKGWPVNSQISSDIVRWPAVILSPAWYTQTCQSLTREDLETWRPGNSARNWGSVNPGQLKRCIKLLAEAWELGKTVYTTDKWDCTGQNVIVKCSALLVY